MWGHHTPPQLLIVLFVQQIWLKLPLWVALCPQNARALCSSTWLSQVLILHKKAVDTPRTLLSTRTGAQHSPSMAQVSPLGLLLPLHHYPQSQFWNTQCINPQHWFVPHSTGMWCLFGSCCGCAFSELPLESLCSPPAQL